MQGFCSVKPCLLICAVYLSVFTGRGAALDVISTLITGGNGDHAINPNECNDLSILVTNNSGVPVTGISAVLSFSTVLGVEITQPYSAYADVPIGGQSTNLSPFQISTLPSYICRDAINLQLTFTTATHGNFVVPLTIPPNGNCTPGSGPCGFCLPPISDAITTDDAVEPGRLSRNLVLSRCAAPKGFPGVVSGSVHYNTYVFTNTSASDACVTVGLTAMCEVMASAYVGNFDPANIASNYLGDSTYSTSPGLGTNFPFSCMVPAGAPFVVVVNEIDPNVGCTNYVLTVSGLPCKSPALAIGGLANSGARLSWPDSAGGYVLESSSSVQSGMWTTVTNEPLIDGGSYNVTNDIVAPGKFYRLHKP